MAYPPPVGTVDLSLAGSYTPPVGTANLSIGATAVSERFATLAGVTATPTGALVLERWRIAVLAGLTATPTGQLTARRLFLATLAGTTAAPTGRLPSRYEPNLLSAVHQIWMPVWQDGNMVPQGIQDAFQGAPPRLQAGPGRWQEGDSFPESTGAGWNPSAFASVGVLPGWQEGGWLGEGKGSGWQPAPRLEQGRGDHWQAADSQWTSALSRFQVRLPLDAPTAIPVWQHGEPFSHHVLDGMRDGTRRLAVAVEVWQWGGIPGNAPNLGPPIPILIRPPWGTALHLRCPLPGAALRIGRTPCILIAEREIPIRRTYMTVNSAALVRWPDLTPLPCTALTVETDFDSWCWSLSATLAGPAAWVLVQPNPLACEVQATINGQIWRFLLDVPSRNRAFNSDRTTLKGRSRSAWLHEPYTLGRNFSQLNARTMQQLGEAALDNTGWTLDWQGENWLVPAGRYTSWNTPIGELIRLVNTTDDGLYTDPMLQIVTAQKRWPVASWLVDGETADIAIPESAILSLTQNPVYSQPYNGVYVSGTSHGALALVKIAGTDGALQPAEPITHELLCDEAGVAARQRGLNALSDSGAGWEMDAETLFAPSASPAFPLVPPGQIVYIAGLKGVSRSCKISAQWSGDGLSVRQSVGLERREVEDV